MDTPPRQLMKMGGSPTDNNILVARGRTRSSKPYVDKGTIKIVADQWVDNWDAAKRSRSWKRPDGQNNRLTQSWRRTTGRHWAPCKP